MARESNLMLLPRLPHVFNFSTLFSFPAPAAPARIFKVPISVPSVTSDGMFASIELVAASLALDFGFRLSVGFSMAMDDVDVAATVPTPTASSSGKRTFFARPRTPSINPT